MKRFPRERRKFDFDDNYLAGIIDARATFTQGTPKLPVISVKMHSKLPKALYKAFGGSFGNYVDEDHGWWRLSGKDAIRFLKRVKPYLRFKRAEAKRLIARWEERHEEVGSLEHRDFYNGLCLRETIFIRERNRCFYCLKKIKRGSLTIDHVVPLDQGGDNSYRNLVACCRDCNVRKNDRLSAKRFLKKLCKRGHLSRKKYAERCKALKALRAGRLVPPKPIMGGVNRAL